MGMAVETGKPGKGPKPSINVTPLVDVVLVLLIIFMLIIPNMQDDKPIELVSVLFPDKDADSKDEPLVVTVDRNEVYTIDDQDMARAQAIAFLRDAYARSPRRKVLLRWSPVAAATSYQVLLHDQTVNKKKTVSGVTGTSLKANVTAGHAYEWRIRSTKGSKNSPYASGFFDVRANVALMRVSFVSRKPEPSGVNSGTLVVETLSDVPNDHAPRAKKSS